MSGLTPRIGEGFAGTGAHVAHVNTVLGERDGPVGAAWATALASPRPGHVPFLCVVQPGIPVQPPTLFVNKATLAGERHETLTWGPAQAGVAAGVMDFVRSAVGGGRLVEAELERLVLIAAVWVDPAAEEAGTVFANNRLATATALERGWAGEPALADVLAAAASPWNPYYRPG